MFVPELPEKDNLSGVITVVDSANAEYLTIPELTSHYDGPVAVNKVGDNFQPLKAWYNIRVDINDTNIVVDQFGRGTLLAEAEPESLALRFWRRAVHVVMREVFI